MLVIRYVKLTKPAGVKFLISVLVSSQSEELSLHHLSNVLNPAENAVDYRPIHKQSPLHNTVGRLCKPKQTGRRSFDGDISDRDPLHGDVSKLIFDPLLLMQSAEIPTEFFFENNFQSIIPSRDDWVGNKPVRSPDREIVCYTDGCRRDGFSGAGVY